MEKTRIIIAKNICLKTRLDSFLANFLGQTKNQIQILIKNNLVLVNKKLVNKNGYILSLNDEIEILENKSKDIEYKIEESDLKFDIKILYENDNLLVINKPPFLVVHSAPSVKEATLVDFLRFKGYGLSTISGAERYGIVHRIDKQTSGALCIAKDNETHNILSDMLKDKSMGRIYIAIIDIPLKENIILESHISRSVNNRLKMKSYNGEHPHLARYAKSQFVKIMTSQNQQYEMIAIKLFTGRTHQIRAQLESIGRHILGDTMYGDKTKNIPRVMLHAYILYFDDFINKKDLVKVCAPIFPDMVEFVNKNFSKDIYENLTMDNIIKLFT